METGQSNNGNERCIISKGSSWFSQFRNASNPWMARYVYALFFLVANLLAWAARDYGRGALTEMERLKGCNGGKDCLGAEGVLRVSLGCFIFYIIMFLSTAGTSKLNVTRDTWHSGWWSVKIVLWIAMTVIPFLLPSEFIQIYGEVAHFGAGVFLLIQLVSIIRFITWLNECCESEKYAARCQIHVMFFATTAYVICLVGIILMYICEPTGENCIRKSDSATKTDWLSIISFVVAILAIVIATFSTGIDSKCFQFRKDDTPAEDDVPYGYGFFHFVFATGAMYFAMLLIGWNSHHSMRKWTIDVGWTSTWVRIINEWLAVCVYLWILVAPILWKNRHAGST
ncbi:probable serine incorporator isoform X2 [Arachis ipaensis]|uniref:probable serine incorporator isoform X2 n=1 Tax=Arachis ipaensis TaxID=130454 RepID=UPI000A2B4014|nr:probable serine incorporator isoform X2 [Arachis ipaensis]